jgi:hypothetical protein
MPRGGKRAGAGRPKGSQNRKTAEFRAEIAASGELPLDYMLRVMRDPTTEPPRRDAMAKAAAPFVHRPLAPQADYEMLWRRQLWQLSLVELRALKARYLQATPLIEQRPLQNGDGEESAPA